jgi:type IV pilus assembly protein PilB
MRISDAELQKLLAGSGKVSPAAIAEAVKASSQSGEPLFQVVTKRKLISEKTLVELYGRSIGVPFVSLGELKIPRPILTKIPERIAAKYQVVVFAQDPGDGYRLAMADPEDLQALDFIKKQIGSDLKIYVALPNEILAVIDQYKGSLDTEINKAIQESATGEQETPSEEVSAEDLTEDAPVAKTVNIILEYAVKSRASDVHIEPRENIVQVRYRVDGVLRETMSLPRPLLAAIVSRIKILANLKIDEHRLPQDGRFKFTVGARTVALRVSSLPVMDGEKVVMRLLDESSRALTLEELGFEGRALEIIKRNITKPHGMILVTGPTGSGKSTTLYSILNILNTPGVNISTVEDPVEYRIQGVNQTQVNPKIGMTFANGLRALLRQDPNIIMVGEVRDSETADLAVQAALTGHLVLSTLHTNNAATSLPRLLDMKIEPFLIASTVNTVIGQRLVRQLCPVCRVPYSPEPAEVAELKQDFQVDEALTLVGQATLAPAAAPVAQTVPAAAGDGQHKKVISPTHSGEQSSIIDKIKQDPNIINRSVDDAQKAVVVNKIRARAGTKQPAPTLAAAPPPGEFTLYKPGPGCGECTEGYTGRAGIYEVLEVDVVIGKMIINRATSEEIQAAAVKAGMHTMQQDGFLKALRGKTTVEEVLRVTRE